MKYRVLNGPKALRKGIELPNIPSLGSIISVPKPVGKLLRQMGLDPASFDMVVAYLDRSRSIIAVTRRLSRSTKAPVELDLHSGKISCEGCGKSQEIEVVQLIQHGHSVINLPATLALAEKFVKEHSDCSWKNLHDELGKSSLN